jgi:hypothetical protein
MGGRAVDRLYTSPINRGTEPRKGDTTMHDDTILVLFPTFNNNDHLADNDRRIFEYSLETRCKIVKTITLTDEQYQEVAESLLMDRAEMWQGIGGSTSDAPECRGIHWTRIVQDAELISIWRQTCYTPVVRVCRENGEEFFVNTEGYAYARCVGRRAF